MRKHIAIAVAASALLACHRKQLLPARAPEASAAPLLQRAITKDLLGERVEYLESIIGPAMHVAGPIRDYRPDGCVFQVGVKDDSVDWFRLKLSNQCTFNPTLLIQDTKLKTLNGLTFAQAEKLDGPLHYSSDCLDGCEGDGPFGMYAHFYKNDSPDRIGYALEVNAADGKPLAAFNSWKLQLLKQHRSEMVIATTVNCSQVPNGGAKYLADLRVSHVWVGRDIITPDASCAQSEAVSQGAADDGIHANVVDNDSSAEVYTEISLRQKLLGIPAQKLLATLGRPESVYDGYPAGKVFFYDTAEGGVNAANFKVFDSTSGTPLTSITISLDARGYVSNVAF